MGEQIDLLSGNLNYTLPLLKVMGRGGWGVSFSLNYNSQLWRQDGTVSWKLGRDVGYGFGWKLLAGSLTPYWSDLGTLHHWTFTDASGAEYRLDVNTSGVWTTQEGTYLNYDSNTQRLYFNDGSFWVFGCVAAGSEQDAGTRYPTLMQDRNGNQVDLYYFPGVGTNWSNSSARLQMIDVRRNQGSTFAFAYNTDPIPHLTTISNDPRAKSFTKLDSAPGRSTRSATRQAYRWLLRSGRSLGLARRRCCSLWASRGLDCSTRLNTWPIPGS